MKSKQDTNFWPAYSDLMTSLFFIMLVLFVLSFFLFKTKEKENGNSTNMIDSLEHKIVRSDSIHIQQIQKHQMRYDSLHSEYDTLKVDYQKFLKIASLDSAIQKLDSRYFRYKRECKRHELKIDIQFGFNKCNLEEALSDQTRAKLVEAGKAIEELINKIKPEDKIKYLLVIEGRAGKLEKEEQEFLNREWGRSLSYERARSLFEFWISDTLITINEDVCEVIVAGSAYWGACRNERGKNRTFSIQIMPKVGEMGVSSLKTKE